MSSQVSYAPVLKEEEEVEPDGIFAIDGDAENDGSGDDRGGVVHPLEVTSAVDEGDEEEGPYGYQQEGAFFDWKDPWVPSIAVTVSMVPVVLIGSIWILYDLTGRIWTTTPFSLHLLVSLSIARYQIPNELFPDKVANRFWTSFACLLDLIFFGFVYRIIYTGLIDNLFMEPDGTTVIEWSSYKRRMQVFRGLGLSIVVCRSLIALLAVSRRCNRSSPSSRSRNPNWRLFPFLDGIGQSCTTETKQQLRRILRIVLNVAIVASILLSIWCLFSVAVHWVKWTTPVIEHEGCDPLDETECWLPFPSFHQMRPDNTTATGWRVHLRGRNLPPLKGGISMNPHFLNDLDGFSTMAPMLFYMEGMKEAYEANVGSKKLQGPANIEKSTTVHSVTLLLDVQGETLVSHSAEVDYLDPDHPLIMVFPARPLQHNRHYALAVVGAVGENGYRLPRKPGLAKVLADKESERRNRYDKTVIPALEKAAPWLRLNVDMDSLQLLFDFHTISEESQLGPVRAVRDATLRHIQSPEWGSWKKHVRANRIINRDCEAPGTLIARTIDAELDVPWFITSYGKGSRGAFLDDNAVRKGTPVTVGASKFVVHIPCSVRAAALGNRQSKPLRAVMEYGHGLFANRDESMDSFLLKLANDEGYAITAMDWRGMSLYDLPIVVKTLLSTPRLFQAVRDNLIQGYAAKYALQDFTKNGMLSMDWFQFRGMENQLHDTKTLGDQPPSQVFYGISQGGILGAGYTALSGVTGLIDRGVLGVPGTPFALIMSRSLDFQGYDAILLLNFYNNRHVRALLSLVQMAWDSVEGSGALAAPVNEPFPRMLLQAGLGDAVVPTIAAEALARGLNASILPNNPRHIFGLPVELAADETWNGPNVTLTELLFEQEYASLPVNDVYAEHNAIHYCTRRDSALISQLAVFVNTGRVTDPCVQDLCRRPKSGC